MTDIPFAPDMPTVEPRLRLRAMSQVQPRQVQWLVQGMIPLHTLTLVAGVGGLGKTTWLLGQAAAGSIAAAPWPTIIVSFEDTAAEVLRPRLEAAGANLDLVHEIVAAEDDLTGLVLPDEVDELRGLVRQVRAQLVIIDPIVAAFTASLDSFKDQHVRLVLAQLARLAEDEHCAIALVGHLNKAPTADAYLRVANSVAFWNASRSVVLVTEDVGDDDTLRLVVQRKANYARLSRPERHCIDEIILPDSVDSVTGAPIVTSCMRFVEFAEDVDGSAVLGPQKTTKTESAETVLEALLADGDWHESGKMKSLLAAAGFNDRLVKRAARELGVEYDDRGFPRKTWWRLPVGTHAPSQGVPTVDPAQPSGSDASQASSRDNSAGDLANVPTANANGQINLATARLDDIHRAAEEGRV